MLIMLLFNGYLSAVFNDAESMFLALYGPCIVKNLRNKNQRDALSF